MVGRPERAEVIRWKGASRWTFPTGENFLQAAKFASINSSYLVLLELGEN